MAKETATTTTIKTPLKVRLGRFTVNLLDLMAFIAILMLAILGARTLIVSGLSAEFRLGFAVAMVLLLSARVVERFTQARR